MLRARVALTLGDHPGEVLLAQTPILHHVVPTSVHLRSPFHSSLVATAASGNARLGKDGDRCFSSKRFGPRSWCPGATLRNLLKLEAHVLIATARTSGRTSPPKTGLPMCVKRMCICPFGPFASLQQPGHSTRPRGRCQQRPPFAASRGSRENIATRTGAAHHPFE